MRLSAVAWLALLCALLCGATPLVAQVGGPILLADSVRVDPEDRSLIAEGNVEVFYGGVSLRAARAIYRDGADRVEIQGPIRLTGTDGGTVVLADAASLSADLQDGLLQGARLLLAQELQLTAARVERIGGRYARLSNSFATSCRVCAGGAAPWWEIRAREVIYDQIERQIYFRNAQIRAFGVPIAWLPRLRLPDPTVDRMTGLLPPVLRNSDTLGFGVKIPYFRTLGDHADLLLTPYVTDGGSATLEYRYRQAFRTGDIALEGAVTRDNLTNDPWRAYLFAKGGFALPDDWTLRFDIEVTSDPSYLLDYDYSDRDRLPSTLSVERVGADRYAGAEILAIQSLREDDADDQAPAVIGDALWAWRFVPSGLGGQGQLTADLHGSGRDGSGNGDQARDTLRFSGRGDWRRTWQLAAGMRAGLIARLDGDLYLITQDDAYDDTVLRFSPRIAAEWRWPLIRRGTAATHLLEPVAQLVWASQTGGTVPNDDSVIVEFDETNLFALSRFPGQDRTETGLFANLGLLYTRRGADGRPMRLAFGRVLRATERDQFTAPSGLDGAVSDWVIASQFGFRDGGGVIGRAVFDDSFSFSNAEIRLALEFDRFDLATSFLWVEQDPAEGMKADMSEWALDAGWRIARNWRANARWRYDAVDGEPTRAGLGLIYANECIAVELSARRRFTSARGASPSNSFSIELSFDGFGDGGPGPRSCPG
jgi:LPS-assembly protein